MKPEDEYLKLLRDKRSTQPSRLNFERAFSLPRPTWRNPADRSASLPVLYPHECERCGRKATLIRPNPTPYCGDCTSAILAKQAAHKKHLSQSGITPRHALFANWSDLKGPAPYERIVAAVRDFAESSSSVLALLGNRGTGKTQIASVAIRAEIDRGNPARIITATKLAADFTRRWGTGNDAEREWLAEWKAPRLLCIDEIGVLVASDQIHSMLTTLIDERYGEMTPTIIIGNVSAQDLESCIGKSVMDRCNEGGKVIDCKSWQSFRKASA